MRKIRRILSLLLTVAIVLTTMPLEVFAEEVKEVLTEITTEEERFDDRVYELFEESKIQSDSVQESNEIVNSEGDINEKELDDSQNESSEAAEAEQAAEESTEIEAGTEGTNEDQDDKSNEEETEIDDEGNIENEEAMIQPMAAAAEKPFAMKIPDLSGINAPNYYNFNSQEKPYFRFESVTRPLLSYLVRKIVVDKDKEVQIEYLHVREYRSLHKAVEE